MVYFTCVPMGLDYCISNHDTRLASTWGRSGPLVRAGSGTAPTLLTLYGICDENGAPSTTGANKYV